MRWKVPQIWPGGDVWIIGGGPSVIKQFGIPENIANNVISKKSPLSEFSPYMSPLHDKHVIGINIAYKIGNWIDWVFFGDPSFFLANSQALSQFNGLKISCASTIQKYDWIKYLPINHNHFHGISPVATSVSWNNNSGAAAISVAAHTGAKRIILLGFDMKLENDKQHWHNEYNSIERVKRKPWAIPFQTHLKGFPSILEDAKQMGIEIINANPDSAITCFQKVALKELL